MPTTLTIPTKYGEVSAHSEDIEGRDPRWYLYYQIPAREDRLGIGIAFDRKDAVRQLAMACGRINSLERPTYYNVRAAIKNNASISRPPARQIWRVQR